VIGPPGIGGLLERLAAAFGEWVTTPGFPLAVREIADGETFDLAPGVRLAARPVPHTPESMAYSVEHGGRRLVYTGDTALDPGLGEWAAGCDVLLAECSLPQRMAVPGHLTPESCGELAATANPRHLVLTHFYPPVLDEDIPAIVGARYAGPVTLAHDGWHMEIEDD
jgi:ribonuclease BN (tRNA processing enzyme)